MALNAVHLRDAATETAPDGSLVHILANHGAAGTAVFVLPPRAISIAQRHRTVTEVWYVLSGSGRIWLSAGDDEREFDLEPGLSCVIPVGTAFQFRSNDEELRIHAVTTPPWPGADEAVAVPGRWQPTLPPPHRPGGGLR